MTANTTAPAAQLVDETIAQLTAKGRDTMTAVGRREFSFFDQGIVEDSGIWGSCLVQEAGHKSSGVVNRLRDLGLWNTTPATETDDSDWWYLTALGAAVANKLAAEPVVEAKPAKSSKKKSELGTAIVAAITTPKSDEPAKGTTRPGEYVRHDRKSRATGTVMLVLDLTHAPADGVQIPETGEKWATQCAEHGTVTFSKTHRAARDTTWAPQDWCRKCATVVRKRAAAAESK